MTVRSPGACIIRGRIEPVEKARRKKRPGKAGGGKAAHLCKAKCVPCGKCRKNGRLLRLQARAGALQSLLCGCRAESAVPLCEDAFSFKMPRGVPQGRCRGVQSEAADEDCRARRRGPKDLFVNNSAEKQSFLTSWNWEV